MLSSTAALLLLLALAPLVPGIVSRTRSALTGRRGAPVTQLYSDLWKLSRRGAVYSVTTTWAFRLAPIAVLTSVLVAATLVPLDGTRAIAHFSLDGIAFVYALAAGRFLLVLGALDTGSSFEGMGASREVAFASLVEPGLVLALAVLSLASRELSLTGMLGPALASRWSVAAPSLVMVAAGLFVLSLAECARVPVDDPNTHLELTMIHEVMVLDHTGPDLAMILYASAVKLALFGALIVCVLAPRSAVSPIVSLGVLAAGLVTVGVAVGIVEATMARLRLPKVPLYIAGAAALAGFGLVLVLR